MADRSGIQKLTNTLGVAINPATEEKQDAIIAALGGIGGTTAYDSRFEDTGTYMYVGEAVPGTTDGTALWRIKRYVDTTLQGNYADGTSDFIKKWTDRATYTY